MGIPDGWNDYDRVGKQVHGTRFIAFKVPLKEATNKGSRVPEENQLYPELLVKLVPKLGLIIDLTNTLKYYNPNEFSALGVAYQKIHVKGHVIPNNQCFTQFRETVKAFLAENSDNEKLIGVHCTHGLNRSGFLVCRYMIEEMGKPPLDAIAAFEIARGHKMERENYLERLKNLPVNGGVSSRIPRKEKLPSLAVDTELDKGTQTQRGFWIDEASLPPHHRNSTPGTFEFSDHASKQVSLIGCVDVQKRDLIPDGHGGYFVHITKKEIQRHEPRRNEPQRHDNHRPVNQRHEYQRSRGGAQPNLYTRHANSPSRPYMQRRSRFDHPMGAPPPQYMDHQLPLGNNNLAEGLLRMQSRNSYGNAQNMYQAPY